MTRRPLDGARRVTGDTRTHAAYGVRAATDYGADTGEAVRAPFSGYITRWWSDTGGWSVAITDSTWKWTGQHNSGYRGPTSGWVNEGTLIAVSGNTGSATSGPHLHNWIEGVNSAIRLSMEDWLRIYKGFGNTSSAGGTVPGPYQTSTAGGDLIPFPDEPEKEEDDMKFVKHPTQNVWFLFWGDYSYRQTSDLDEARDIKAFLGYGSNTDVSAEFITAEKARRDAIRATFAKQVAAEVGTPASGGGSTDLAPVLEAIDNVPAATREEFRTNPLK